MSDKSNVGPHLGKVSSYEDSYNPKLLVGIDRQLNRDSIGYSKTSLPFLGSDLWNAYEVSALLNNGFPFVGIIRFRYSALSPKIVESKSLKLYLNSFNQTHLGEDLDIAKQELLKKIGQDLSRVVGSEVEGVWVSASDRKGFKNDFLLLESISKPFEIYQYQEDSKLLEWKNKNSEIKVRSELLRSRCKETGQPDWGDVFIYLKGNKIPDLSSLLRLIISYRSEMHFHEEIVESLFYHLWKQGNPQELLVTAQYTRRGGVDINPTRYSETAKTTAKQFEEIEKFSRVQRQ